MVSCLSSFWISDGGLILLPKWDRSRAENGPKGWGWEVGSGAPFAGPSSWARG